MKPRKTAVVLVFKGFTAVLHLLNCQRQDNKKNQKLEAEIEELQKLKDSASQRAKDIKDVVEELAKDEYEKVGPALGKFYNKLIRFNSSDGINIVQDLLMKDFQNEDICGQHKNRIGCSFL